MFLQLLQRNADYYPDEIAITYDDDEITNKELLQRVEQVAHGLAALGLKPGGKVAVFLENSPEFLISFFAVAACRGTNVPLNIEYKEDEVSYFVSDAQVDYIITDPPRLNTAKAAAAASGREISVITTGAPAEDAVFFEDLAKLQGTADLDSFSPHDHVVYIYSSGSTGRPKCAPRTTLQYWWEMNSVIAGLNLSRDDRIFCAIPFYHNFGAVHCMLAGPGSGARLVMLKTPNPILLSRKRALTLLENETVTIFPGVPFIFEHLTQCKATADLSSIRVCYSAAAALTEEIADAFSKKFDLPIRDHYGCTEVGAMTIDLDPVPRQHGRTVGKPFPGVTIRVIDEDGNALPPNTEGELLIGSRAMTSGYLGLEDENKEAFKDNFFQTGDLGCVDDEGRLYLRGRKKFVIDVTGHKIDPYEVEDVLLEHPQTESAVVIGVKDEKIRSNVVKAYVVRTGDCDANELIAFCREKLANFKVPSIVEFISEVPTNSLGKILRKPEVLDQYLVENGPARQAGNQS